jgi:CHAT domain
MADEQADYPRMYTYEDPTENLYRDSIDRLNHIRDRKTIHVTWHEETILCSLVNSEGNIEDGGELLITGGPASIQELLESIAGFLKVASSRTYHRASARKSLLQNLEGLGSKLLKKLLPTLLGEKVKSWPDGTWVTISSNEQWIPWELLHDGHGFLGARFMLFRLPRVQRSNREKPCANPVQVERMLPHKIIHIIGGNLSRNRRLLYEKTLADFIEEIVDAELIHLTCHGHLKPLRLQISREDDVVLSLTIDSFETTEFRLKEGSVVFANACNSATAVPQFGEFLSFGWEFYRKGAAVFIGTLGTVPIDAALAFANAFYSVLVNDKDGDISLAFRTAKNETDNDSLVHLLYCFYGNPLEIPGLSFS